FLEDSARAMKTKSKVWLGIGAFVITGTALDGHAQPVSLSLPDLSSARGAHAEGALSRARSGGVVLAQHGDHAKEPGKDAGEGGEGKGLANLPPDLAFAVRISLLRGHLLVGDELVKQKQWNAALPHFLHPIEEIYDELRGRLDDYKTPAFEEAL